MTEATIENSFQLEFIAYYSMHLENLYSEATDHKDCKQRDRYMQLIAYINETTFESAYAKYRQIALADTENSLFTADMLGTARHLASIDLGLPLAG